MPSVPVQDLMAAQSNYHLVVLMESDRLGHVSAKLKLDVCYLGLIGIQIRSHLAPSLSDRLVRSLACLVRE